jgi:hypothetical protein
MIFYEFGHRFGNLAVKSDIQEDIVSAINKAKTKPEKRISSKIKEEIMAELYTAGWSPEVELDPESRITITSCKDRIGLVFQTGNVSRMYADLLKLQAMYLKEKISAGVFILPTSTAAKKLGDNISNFERLKKELNIFDRVISVPIMIFGFE